MSVKVHIPLGQTSEFWSGPKGPGLVHIIVGKSTVCWESPLDMWAGPQGNGLTHGTLGQNHILGPPSVLLGKSTGTSHGQTWGRPQSLVQDRSQGLLRVVFPSGTNYPKKVWAGGCLK